MNIGEYAIRKKTITLVLTVMAVVAGFAAYDEMGRLEDPEFTIKEAMIYTPYPGASAAEVEREVTNEIERAVQELGQLKRIQSYSLRGLSIVRVVIKDKYKKNQLPQVWDEMRRKVEAAQPKLPPGVKTAKVDDDFGDVYGVYVAITGEGYTMREIKDFADLLQRELLLVKDVKRIVFWGVTPERIYVEMNREKMARLGITQQQIFSVLEAKNLAAAGGHVRVGPEFITIDPSGQFTSEKEFVDLLISEPGAPQQIHLGDVAEIRRGYVDPPDTLMRMSYKTVMKNGRPLTDDELDGVDLDDPSLAIVTTIGQPAIGLAISTVPGGNVVQMGEALEKRVQEMASLIPHGMDAEVIALQSSAVIKAVNGFMVNLIEAIAIVVIVLLFFMGMRSGLLIGFILLLTITASFIIMKAQGILLERISLGALIIALGMLVDNAIVVTEGMQIRIEGGEDKIKAARAVVGQNQWPLLGATFVAVIAFAAIGLSTHSTGEYCRSLFYVLLISLMMSWLTAVTVTPLLCVMLFKPKTQAGDAGRDPYGGTMFRLYRRFLETAIRRRYVTIAVVAGLFVLAVNGFGLLPQSFFPWSSRPQLLLDVWMPQGTHIRATEKAIEPLEEYLMSLDNTKSIAGHVGSGGARFLLVYSSERPNSGYAQFVINVFDAQKVPQMMDEIEAWMHDNMPGALTYCKRFKLGPGEGGNIQARFSGPDSNVLRALADEATAIMYADPVTKYVRNGWNQPVKILRPLIAEEQARRLGITRTEVANRLEASFEGLQVGVYREGTITIEDRLIPIVSRPPQEERGDVDSIQDVQIFSPAANQMIPLRQVVHGFETAFEEELVERRNRLPTIILHADQKYGETSQLLGRIKPQVDQMFADKLASGEVSAEYKLEWGGEYEDGRDSKAALASSLPMFAVLMVLVVIALFNNLRQPLIIWLTVPLALIGVSAGLLTFGLAFDFMAILGTLSLSGMLIKNAIVLMDEINSNNAKGLPRYQAVVDAGVSRMRPVLMAAATTVLGMIPLLPDIFFRSMAVAIMFGLTFATALTLVIVPVLYATFYGAKKEAVPAG